LQPARLVSGGILKAGAFWVSTETTRAAKMAKTRDAAKERYWRGVIRRCEASGLGARRFCEREKLSEHRLGWWRRTLRERDQEQAVRLGKGGTGQSARGKADKPGRSRAGRPIRRKAAKAVRRKVGGLVRGGRGEAGGDSAFLPVGLPFSVSVGERIEVVHPRGHVVRVPAVFDAAALGRVLAAIDGQTGASEGP
jgi:hypothetical protein